MKPAENPGRTRSPAHGPRLTRRQLAGTVVLLGVSAPVLGLAAGTHRVNTNSIADASPPASAVTPELVASPSPGASPTAAVIVTMTSAIRFVPAETTIRAGETVRWVNASPIPHTTTDDPAKNPIAQAHPEWSILPDGAKPWDSGLLQQGQTFSHTFTVPGVYAYFCIPHILSGMRGTVTVTDRG